MFKLYTAFTHSELDIEQEDINFDELVRFQLKNNNLYFNSSFKYFFDNGLTLNTGVGLSLDANNIGWIEDRIETREKATHVKIKLQKGFNSRLNISLGAEYFLSDYQDTISAEDGFTLKSGYKDHLAVLFTEADIFFSQKLAMKLGIRAEHTDVLGEYNVAPRVSLAYKSSKNGQFSLAYGDFYQNPLGAYLKFNREMVSEKTSHYILNYQYLGDGRTFRAEAFYKDYDNLVKYNSGIAEFNSVFSNTGYGYASGLDLFWRDNQSIDYLDYWISYSYLDTERDYRSFREQAPPNFAAKHNFSMVTKYFITDWRSQVGLSYTYSSGRPYNNPNTSDFMAAKTPGYNNFSINWAYLIDQQKILYFSVNNVLGFNNINNYQYSNTPNTQGIFESRAVQPAADSFFFVGFFWTISADKKSNQLDNL